MMKKDNFIIMIWKKVQLYKHMYYLINSRDYHKREFKILFHNTNLQRLRSITLLKQSVLTLFIKLIQDSQKAQRISRVMEQIHNLIELQQIAREDLPLHLLMGKLDYMIKLVGIQIVSILGLATLSYIQKLQKTEDGYSQHSKHIYYSSQHRQKMK